MIGEGGRENMKSSYRTRIRSHVDASDEAIRSRAWKKVRKLSALSAEKNRPQAVQKAKITRLGFEPRLTVPKTVVLPLHHQAMLRCLTF